MSADPGTTVQPGKGVAPDPADGAAAIPERVVPLRHPWRWAGMAVVAVLVAMLVNALVTESGFQWRVVGHYLFSSPILHGVLTTIWLTAATMALAIVIGLLLAVMRLSPNPIFSAFAGLYISLFRAIPGLVQMIFWFNLAALIPRLSIGVPFGPHFWSFSATSVFSPFVAALAGLGLSESAYVAEIFRGGINSVPHGQVEAARAVGLNRTRQLRYIVLPQAMKSVIPPLGNEVIGMLKYTSLASVISVTELMESAEVIYNQNFDPIPLLIVATLWYIALTTALTVVQRRIEQRFGRGTTRDSGGRRSLAGQVWSNAFGLVRRPATVSGGPA